MRGKLAGLCAVAGLVLAGDAFAQTATETAPIVLVDQRPVDELRTSWLSRMITSCEYGIRRVADQEGGPSRMEGLKADLQSALGAALGGKTVSVTHYASYFNAGAYERGITYSKFGGVVPDLMSKMGSKCSREDTKAGWYQASEVTNLSSPIVVELTVSVDGKSYETRSVYSPETELNPFFSKDKNAPVALAAALKKANAALIAQVGADVAPVVAVPAPAPTAGPPSTP